MIKQKLFVLCFLFIGIIAIAQVKVGENSSTIHPSSILEMESTNKALLLPRMTTVQRNGISSPAVGLTIYNINTNCINWWDGISWKNNCTPAEPEPEPNTTPVANAGIDKSIKMPLSTSSLNGSGTDTDGIVVSYLWSQLSGPLTATIANTGLAVTSATGLTSPGEYEFQLTVTDNDGAVHVDTVIITVVESQFPLAEAGDNQVVQLPVTITLDATASSDPDGTIVNWLWTRVSGPNTPTITNSNGVITTVTGLVAGTYVFQIRVRDNDNLESTDTVTIEVFNTNVPPVSVTNATIRVLLGDPVTLDGTASYDTDGTVVTYQWIQTAGSIAYTIDSPTSAITTISNIEVPGWATFTLYVTDNLGATRSASVKLYLQTGGSFGSSHGEATVPFSDNTYCEKRTLTVSGCNGQTSITTPGGQTISLVEVNGQCWFGENMTDIPSAYNPAPAFVANTENGHSRMDNYGNGRWYQLSAALNGQAFGDNVQGICPAGFHIPSDCDWMYLEHGLGASVASQLLTSGNRMNAIGLKLQSPSGSSGMNLKSGGGLSNTGSILLEGRFGRYMSIGYSPNYNTVRTITYVANSGNGSFNRGLSSPMGEASYVRCLKD